MFHVYWRIDIEKYLKMRPLSVPIASHILEKMHPTRYYLVYENVSLAEGEIYKAIELWGNQSNSAWAYQVLGEIYENEGMLAQAISAYEKAVQLAPTDAMSKEKLQQVQNNMELEK